MKNLSILPLLIFVICHSEPSRGSQDDDCECEAVQTPAGQLVSTLKAVSESFYKDIASLKVSMDGEGKFSVNFEKGIPKLVKLTYKNGDGTEIIQKSFAELERGIPLIYEDKDKPGKAIALQAGNPFKVGTKYNEDET